MLENHNNNYYYYSTYDLALHQSACYLLATRVKKEQKAAIRELQPLAQ